MRPADPPELELQTVSQHGGAGAEEEGKSICCSLFFTLQTSLNYSKLYFHVCISRCPRRLHTAEAGVRAA